MTALCSVLFVAPPMSLGSPSGSEGKESAYKAGDPGLIPMPARSGESNGNPLQYSCLESCIDRSLGGDSPWGPKESDTTE